MEARNNSSSEIASNTIDLFTKVTLFIMISILWAVFSSPIVTLPASTTAVILGWRVLTRNSSYRSTLSAFLMCFKKTFFKSLPIGIPILISFYITYLDLTFFVRWSNNILGIVYIGVMCFVDYILLMVGLSALALLTRRNINSKQAVLIAVRGLFEQLGRSILIIVGVIVVAGISVLVPKLGFLIFGGSVGWSANKLIKRR